jgi:hypothetical protein
VDVGPRAAMRILGHGKISVTLGICAGVPGAGARQELRRLGQALA